MCETTILWLLWFELFPYYFDLMCICKHTHTPSHSFIVPIKWPEDLFFLFFSLILVFEYAHFSYSKPASQPEFHSNNLIPNLLCDSLYLNANLDKTKKKRKQNSSQQGKCNWFNLNSDFSTFQRICVRFYSDLVRPTFENVLKLHWNSHTLSNKTNHLDCVRASCHTLLNTFNFELLSNLNQ